MASHTGQKMRVLHLAVRGDHGTVSRWCQQPLHANCVDGSMAIMQRYPLLYFGQAIHRDHAGTTIMSLSESALRALQRRY